MFQSTNVSQPPEWNWTVITTKAMRAILLSLILLAGCTNENPVSGDGNFYIGGFDSFPNLQSYPAWHPSGNIIAFMHLAALTYNSDDGTIELNPDSTGIYTYSFVDSSITFVRAGFYSELSYSADGEWIVFSAHDRGGPYIGRMTANGDSSAKLKTGKVWFPSCSPADSRIVYNAVPPGGNNPYNYALWVMNLDGSDDHLVLDENLPVMGIKPQWSVSGTALFSLKNGLNKFTLNDHATTHIFSKPLVESYSVNTDYNVIATDGVGDGWLYLCDLNGAHKSLLLRDQSRDYQPKISPAGDRIAFIGAEENRSLRTASVLWIMDLDGLNRRQLIHNNGIEIITYDDPQTNLPPRNNNPEGLIQPQSGLTEFIP